MFMDCDMLVLEDIAKLWALRDEKYAVMCVKHDHVPKEKTKFLGAQQTKYEKKNWSSVMLFNCAKCTALTPGYVNSASGLDLHRFNWLHQLDRKHRFEHHYTDPLALARPRVPTGRGWDCGRFTA